VASDESGGHELHPVARATGYLVIILIAPFILHKLTDPFGNPTDDHVAILVILGCLFWSIPTFLIVSAVIGIP